VRERMRLINVTLLDGEKEKTTNRREREKAKPKDIHKGDVLKAAGWLLGSASR
jgi:hypothetical protein